MLKELRPVERNRIYDLVKKAGVNVHDWANVKGGAAKAAANPKYCYEWSFSQPGKVVVLNLWYKELQETERVIYRNLDLRWRADRIEKDTNRKRRARTMDQHLQAAFQEGLPVRVVLLDGIIRRDGDPDRKVSQASKRMLDPHIWAVTAYNWATGECTVTRDATPRPGHSSEPDEELDGFEGTLRPLFILHRQRERKLRNRKIEEALQRANGRLICEVPNCGFDFVERYGALGKGYAHVHHLTPLSEAPKTGRKSLLADMAIVCANCHSMIHRGGECRPLELLIPSV